MRKIFLILILLLTNIIISSQVIDQTNDVIIIPLNDNYLDIVSTNIERINNQYIITLEMNNNIPNTVENDNIFIEWDIMIDIDQNKNTHSWSGSMDFSYLVNDIGLDYMIGLMLKIIN